jgi:hypothetical protein
VHRRATRCAKPGSLAIAELACAGSSTAPKKNKQGIIHRHSRAAGKGKIKKLFGSAETSKNGLVHC